MLGNGLIIIAALFGFLAAVSGIIFGWSLDLGQRQEYQFLDYYHQWRLQFGAGAVAALFIAGAAGVGHQILGRKQQPILVVTQGPGGELIERATVTGLRRELEDAAAEQVREAEDYFNAGERDYTADRYRDAATNYQKSVGVIPTMSAYLNLSNSLFFGSEFSKAAEAANAGVQIARRKRDLRFEGIFLNGIGTVHRNQGKLGEALKSNQEALTIMRQIGDQLGVANSLGCVGLVYVQRGNLQEALESYQESLTIKRQIGNRLGEAQDLGNIGSVYFQQGKLSAALELHQESLTIMRQIGNRLGEANSLGNIGLVYSSQDRLEDALKSQRESLTIQRQIGHRLGEANSLGNIGLVYLRQGKSAEALESHQESLAIKREIGNPLGEANSLGNIGAVHSQQGKLGEALEHFRQARDIFQSIGASIQLQTAERNIATVQAQIEAAG